MSSDLKMLLQQQATRIAFGGASLGRTGSSYSADREVVAHCLESGISVFDTAPAYELSEEHIGRALWELGAVHNVLLITKCGFRSGWQPAWRAVDIRRSLHESMRRLRRSSLDVVMLHGCSSEMLLDGECVDALVQAKKAGLVRWIGYSGDNSALKVALGCDVFDALECSFSMLDMANAQSIEAASKFGLAAFSKRSFSNGVISSLHPPVRAYAAQYWPRWERFLDSDSASAIDAARWREIAVRFVTHAPGIDAAIIGSQSAEHLSNLVKWAELGPLAPPDLLALQARYGEAEGGESWAALE